MATIVERTALQIRDCSLCGAKQPNLTKVWYNVTIGLVTWDCASCEASQGDDVPETAIRAQCHEKVGCMSVNILAKSQHTHDLDFIFGGN
jgi:hypothetical protein